MQHRRLSSEDNRGMGEILDEKDEWDDGIRVSETYFV